eukprot:6750646-Alexandrium_andersonii.AAC.1
MGNYGGQTQKPTKVWSLLKWIAKLNNTSPKEYKDRETFKRVKLADGSSKVCGGEGLKATQEYPSGYGR